MSDPNNSVLPLDAVTVGTRLVTDDGFTCMGDHELKIVQAEPDGALFVPCSEGHHGLDGQECNAGEHGVDFDHFIGFWIEGTEPPKVDPDLHEYTFDVKVFATIRVTAKSEEEARKLYVEAMENAASANFGAFPNGDPIDATFSLDEPDNDELVEVDGEAV